MVAVLGNPAPITFISLLCDGLGQKVAYGGVQGPWRVQEGIVSYTVDFNNVSTVGLESSPVARSLAGLRANEARYFKNKYDHTFTVEPASEAKSTIDWVHRILRDERDIVISSPPLEATEFQVESCNLEARAEVAEFFQSSQALTRDFGQFRIGFDEQIAVSAAV